MSTTPKRGGTRTGAGRPKGSKDGAPRPKQPETVRLNCRITPGARANLGRNPGKAISEAFKSKKPPTPEITLKCDTKAQRVKAYETVKRLKEEYRKTGRPVRIICEETPGDYRKPM